MRRSPTRCSRRCGGSRLAARSSRLRRWHAAALRAVAYTVLAGIGVWGNNIPVAWAFAITNFVWWIGIGHAGTFISAFLLLLEQHWRTSINRFAEAMTIFARRARPALFPLLHLGRPWFFYWLVPYPATMDVWPNFKSALPWDVAAVTTYFTVSLLFWYLGLVPDLARAARPRARRAGGAASTASSRSAGAARRAVAALPHRVRAARRRSRRRS